MHRLLFICCFLLGYMVLYAQADHKPISVSEEAYTALEKELGYDKTKKGLRLRDRFVPKEQEEKPTKQIGFAGAALFRLIAYALIAALVIAIVYMIFGNIKIDKKVNLPDAQDEIIEDIAEVDAEAAYKAAVGSGDHRLAIRMLFIMALQKLNSREHIEWEIEKTNRQYYNEISDSEMRRSFREVSNVYERVWYGDTDLDLMTFRQHDRRFLTFINTIT